MRELFEPASIAVVGASRESTKVGNVILRNLLEGGFSGPIYPVNPKAEEILGLKCYPSLSDIGERVELAVIVTPAKSVVPVTEEAGRLGIKAAVIISAGFKEVGREGAQLESQLAAVARSYGMRVIGPNCLGIINAHHHMNATFAGSHPQPGAIAISSQSGAICAILLDWAEGSGIGFSKFVSVGNKMDIEEGYLLELYRNDPQTKVIGIYIESVDRGREFMRQAQLTSKIKPIIALKAGRTSTGAKAASSHTGALSGSDKVYDAVLAQCGAIRVQTIDEMADLLSIFTSMPLPRDDQVAIVTNAGGLGVMAADALADHNLNLASFEAETVQKLKDGLPAAASIYNPVDVVGDADAERYEFAIRTIMEDDNVSSVLALMAPTDLVDVPDVARTLSTLAKGSTKPVVTAFVGGENLRPAVQLLRASGVPNYETPDRAAFALAAMLRYKELMQVHSPAPVETFPFDQKRALEVLERAAREERLQLGESEGKQLLQAYGIRVPKEGLAKSPEEAVAIAREIGYPVVLKVESPEIAHKTDVGGVVIDLDEDDEVEANFRLILARVKAKMPNARVDGISIQQMFTGREVIVGMVRDDQFGPVITFGLGGIFVEILRDVTQMVAPLSRPEVGKMIRSIKSYPILSGARGRRPADLRALEDVILKVAQMAADHPEISELEINPVIVGDEGQGVGAVDALVTIRRGKT